MSGLHYDLRNAPSASDVASPSPDFKWSQSCLTIWRTQNSSAPRISSSKSSHLPHSRYDTQMTQILLEGYIFITRTKDTKGHRTPLSPTCIYLLYQGPFGAPQIQYFCYNNERIKHHGGSSFNKDAEYLSRLFHYLRLICTNQITGYAVPTGKDF